MMPALADEVKVEVGFASFSTLLVVSILIALWCYLPDDLAIAVVGLIKSSNLSTGEYAVSKTGRGLKRPRHNQPERQLFK